MQNTLNEGLNPVRLSDFQWLSAKKAVENCIEALRDKERKNKSNRK